MLQLVLQLSRDELESQRNLLGEGRDRDLEERNRNAQIWRDLAQQEIRMGSRELQLAVALSGSIAEVATAQSCAQGVPPDLMDELMPPQAYAPPPQMRGTAPAPVAGGTLGATLVAGGTRSAELADDEECSICQENLRPGEMIRRLPCRHAFHCGCIDPWFKRSACCPCCRGRVCQPAVDEGRLAHSLDDLPPRSSNPERER